MDDKADVRPIDSHAESDSSDDDVHSFFHKCFLSSLTFFVAESSVISDCGVADFFQCRGELIDICAAQAIDDATDTGVIRGTLVVVGV